MSDEPDYRSTSAPDNDRLSDSTLLMQAIDLVGAADAYAKTLRQYEQTWMTLHFMFGRSLELALKSFAIHVGATERDLRNKLGHNIEVALAFAMEKGLAIPGGLTTNEEQSISLLAHWYGKKLTEYPLIQGYVVPNSRLMREVVHRVIAAVFVAIWGAQRYDFEINSKRVKKYGMTIDAAADYGEPPGSEGGDGIE